MSVSIETNGAEVVASLGQIAPHIYRRLTSVVEEAAIDVRDAWRENATETAGAHGKHYPRSIQYNMSSRAALGDAIEATIRPDGRFRQGGMSFEFGSSNQPPHLDGQRALDSLAHQVERRIASALVF